METIAPQNDRPTEWKVNFLLTAAVQSCTCTIEMSGLMTRVIMCTDLICIANIMRALNLPLVHVIRQSTSIAFLMAVLTH